MKKNATLTMMTENLKEIGKYSFELEIEREKSLIDYSSKLVVSISFLISIFSLIVSKSQNLNLKSNLLFYPVLIFLFLSFFYAFSACWKRKYKTLNFVSSYWDEISKNHSEYQEEMGFDELWVREIDELHKIKFKNNNNRVKFICYSTVFLFCLALSVLAFIFFGGM